MTPTSSSHGEELALRRLEQARLIARVRQVEPAVRELVRRRLGAQHADDVMQLVYLRLLKWTGNGDDIRNACGFALHAAKYVIIDMLRTQRTDASRIEKCSLEPAPSDLETPEEHLFTDEVLHHLRRHLPKRQLATIILRSQWYSTAEIALQLQSTESMVRRDLQAARRSIRMFLESGVWKNLPPSKFNGILYEVSTELALPETKNITDVTPKILIASSALAERLKRRPEGVHDLTSRQFEELVGELLTDMGASHVEITPFTRDGGRDLLAYMDLKFGRLLCLVEAKKYRPDRTVGIELVRALYGVVCDEDASHGTLVTTSTFSPDARRFESRHRHRLSLQDYDHVAEWIRRYRTYRH